VDMGRAAKTYIYSVIAAGGSVLVWSLAGLAPVHLWSWAVFTALTVLASVAKLRLPGIQGTDSPSFLFLLYGVAHFSLPEVLIAGCAGAVAQCVLNAKTRPSPIQVLFNAANVAVTIGACFFIGRVWLAAGMAHYLPAVIAVVACTYFVVNTVLVSGVLSLLQNKPLAEVCGQWYVWSFPWYLIGVTLVGLVPAPGHPVSGEAWLILAPMVYLVHFFLGLDQWRPSPLDAGGQPNTLLPRGARIYLMAVLAAGVMLLTSAALGWQSLNPTRFLIYLALASVASTFKIQLPDLEGTITPAFVLLLVAIAQVSFTETAFIAAVVGLVQLLWRPARRPMPAQVLFNPACLALSASLAWFVSRLLLDPWLGHSVIGLVMVSTLALYGSNTLIVAVMMALADRKPLGRIWQLCYFWSLPYYLVGAAAAGVMTAVSRAADWPPSLLILPLMGMLYFSYRAQLSQAVSHAEGKF
jgi:hypothetical protein